MESADLTLEGLIHDLNNVFQSIGEGADLLAADPKWSKLAGTLQRSVDRGQRLARSILARGRSSVEIHEVVESAIQSARDYLECIHGPKVDFSVALGPGMELNGDAASWERVLVNLLLNAAEAGASTVHIATQNNSIVVSDDGPGISPELLPHIFQPHVSTKSIMSGLVLHIVRTIVEQHGAHVSAANRPQRGAEFAICWG